MLEVKAHHLAPISGQGMKLFVSERRLGWDGREAMRKAKELEQVVAAGALHHTHHMQARLEHRWNGEGWCNARISRQTMASLTATLWEH